MKPTGLLSTGTGSAEARYTRSMRLGPLILQVCAVLIALALVYAGYAWFSSRELARYVDQVRVSQSVTPADKIASFVDSPGITCTFSSADFGTALSGRIYVAPGKIRYQITNAATGQTVHRLFDESGLSLWTDASPFIERVEPSSPYQNVAPEVRIMNIDCLRWSVNKDAFDLPLGKPVKILSTS